MNGGNTQMNDHNLLAISLLNTFDTITQRIGNGNGFLITAIGLFTVFLGLLILWGVTSNLQRITQWRGIQRKSKSKNIPPQSDQATDELAAAITIALHLELDDEEISVITLRHQEQEMSPWVVASRPATMRHQS